MPACRKVFLGSAIYTLETISSTAQKEGVAFGAGSRLWQALHHATFVDRKNVKFMGLLKLTVKFQ